MRRGHRVDENAQQSAPERGGVLGERTSRRKACQADLALRALGQGDRDLPPDFGLDSAGGHPFPYPTERARGLHPAAEVADLIHVSLPQASGPHRRR